MKLLIAICVLAVAICGHFVWSATASSRNATTSIRPQGKQNTTGMVIIDRREMNARLNEHSAAALSKQRRLPRATPDGDFEGLETAINRPGNGRTSFNRNGDLQVAAGHEKKYMLVKKKPKHKKIKMEVYEPKMKYKKIKMKIPVKKMKKKKVKGYLVKKEKYYH